MSDQVLIGELKKRRAKVLELLKLTPDDHRFGLVIAKIDEEIEKAEGKQKSDFRVQWEEWETRRTPPRNKHII